MREKAVFILLPVPCNFLRKVLEMMMAEKQGLSMMRIERVYKSRLKIPSTQALRRRFGNSLEKTVSPQWRDC
jgi:hypothetical protein